MSEPRSRNGPTRSPKPILVLNVIMPLVVVSISFERCCTTSLVKLSGGTEGGNSNMGAVYHEYKAVKSKSGEDLSPAALSQIGATRNLRTYSDSEQIRSYQARQVQDFISGIGNGRCNYR